MAHLTVVLALLGSALALNVQQPFSSQEEYQFRWPIRKVAVIGAGPSGLVAYRELTEAGLDVRVFERDSVPGGNWHYTEEIPLDAPVPNAPSATGDFIPSLPPLDVDLPYSEEFADDGKIWRDHRGPKPIWESLTSITPSTIQQFRQWPWPAGMQWELSHYQIRNYVRSYASYLNINSNDENPTIVYNTRVELVEKQTNEAGDERGWRLWLRTLKPTQHNTYMATWWTEDFDAVVVATGRYNAPAMPSIPGLQQWVQQFPDLLRHSRQYRRPEAYANQTVLIIGASNSGAEISRDLNRHARDIYQSIRPAKDSISRARTRLFMRRMPRNTTIIGEIKRFLPIPEGSPIQSGLIELTNGTFLSGFDSVIMATGFRYSFPFLSQYYDGATYQSRAGSTGTASTFLPINGLYIRDLYLDIFNTRDPTLAFIGAINGPVQAFLLVDYAALALAKVWTNAARLPDTRIMQAAYQQVTEGRGGYGKWALYVDSEKFVEIVRNMTCWLNNAAIKYGGKQIDGYPEHYAEVHRYWMDIHFREPVWSIPSESENTMLALFGLDTEEGSRLDDDDDDDWLYYGYGDDW